MTDEWRTDGWPSEDNDPGQTDGQWKPKTKDPANDDDPAQPNYWRMTNDPVEEKRMTDDPLLRLTMIDPIEYYWQWRPMTPDVTVEGRNVTRTAQTEGQPDEGPSPGGQWPRRTQWPARRDPDWLAQAKPGWRTQPRRTDYYWLTLCWLLVVIVIVIVIVIIIVSGGYWTVLLLIIGGPSIIIVIVIVGNYC